jgi:hypothetical protein
MSKANASELAELVEAAAETPSEVYAAMKKDPRGAKLADAAEAVQKRGKSAYQQVIDKSFSGASIK